MQLPEHRRRHVQLDGHSLVDKVSKRKDLEVAWEKVKRNRGAGWRGWRGLGGVRSIAGCPTSNVKREGSQSNDAPP